MKDKPEARNARQREWRANMKAMGFAKVDLWVPEERRDEIRAIAEKMREDHTAK